MDSGEGKAFEVLPFVVFMDFQVEHKILQEVLCVVTINLIPSDGRKSFGNKCRVELDGLTARLFSYNTLMCSFDGMKGLFTKLDNFYSATTIRHINAFLDFCYSNMAGYAPGEWREMHKQEWLAIPVNGLFSR